MFRLIYPAALLVLLLQATTIDARTSPQLVDRGDGTVLDAVTQAIWQKCSMGQLDSECSGKPAVDFGWKAAQQECKNLSLAGLKWRLPTLAEFHSIVDTNSAGDAAESNVFSNTPDWAEYWTTSPHPNSRSDIWLHLSGYRGNRQYPKSGAGSVRCISAPLWKAKDRFEAAADGTVLDKKTQLRWQRCSYGQKNDAKCKNENGWVHPESKLDFRAAQAHCSNLALGGYKWRLPSVHELSSLLDYEKPYNAAAQSASAEQLYYRQKPLLESSVFPNTPPSTYWTATANGSTYAYLVEFLEGYIKIDPQVEPYSGHVRCVTDP